MDGPQNIPAGYEQHEIRRYPKSYVLQLESLTDGTHLVRVLKPKKKGGNLDRGGGDRHTAG